MPQLSVIIPAHNEVQTIAEILHKVHEVPVDKEIIVVDDGSFDGTREKLALQKYPNMKVITHPENRGKGAAVLTGLSQACGTYTIIQDADLEYDPQDYQRLLKAIQEQKADMVLGARFKEGHHGLFWHRMGNRVLTRCLNLLFGTRLNDYATCYKLGRTEMLKSLDLNATGFDIDVEILCDVLKQHRKVIEMPISYYPRTYKEGKKIRLKDAFWALFYMVKYRLGRSTHAAHYCHT